MASVRMIYIDERLNRKLKKYGNASKLISELLVAYFNLQEKADVPSPIIPLKSDTELTDELKLTYNTLTGREASQEVINEFLNDYKLFQCEVGNWVLAREKRESTGKQLLIA